MDDSLKRVMALQAQLESINDEMAQHMLELEQQGNQKRAPVLAERSSAIQDVPGFWYCALLGHPLLEQYMTETDTSILEHLTVLEVVDEEDVKSGYTIHLTFSPNAFFTNERLSKTLSYAEDGELSLRATHVEWKKLPPSAGDAEPGGMGSSRKRPRGAKQSAMMAATFLRAFLWLEGQDTYCLLPGDDSADVDHPAGLAEAEAFCEAIKEDVWSNPLQFFERYTFHGEEDGEEDENAEGRQRKKV